MLAHPQLTAKAGRSAAQQPWRKRSDEHQGLRTHQHRGARGIPQEAESQLGAPGTIRTSDPQIRSLVLYPAELRAPFRFISGLTARLQSRSNSGRSRKRPLATGSEADWQGPEGGICQSFCTRKGRRGRGPTRRSGTPRHPQALTPDAPLARSRNDGNRMMFTPSLARCGWSAVPPAGRG